MELEINRRDLTNRVKIPFTLVRNEVGSPSIHQLNEPPRRVEAKPRHNILIVSQPVLSHEFLGNQVD